MCLVVVSAAGLYKFTQKPCSSCPAHEEVEKIASHENTEMDYMGTYSPTNNEAYEKSAQQSHQEVPRKHHSYIPVRERE